MQSRNRSSRPAPRILASALAASLAEVVASCGGGGGGGGGASSAFASHARLLAVTFPDPGHQNTAAADQPPVNVSLVQ